MMSRGLSPASAAHVFGPAMHPIFNAHSRSIWQSHTQREFPALRCLGHHTDVAGCGGRADGLAPCFAWRNSSIHSAARGEQPVRGTTHCVPVSIDVDGWVALPGLPRRHLQQPRIVRCAHGERVGVIHALG
jgi:hypothetical protein